MSVHVNDAPWRALFKRAVAMRTIKARVGILASKGGSAKQEGSDLSLVEIAAAHEFGTGDGHIPERSFLRSTFYVRVASELRHVIANLCTAVIQRGVDPRAAIGQLGAWGAAQVKNTITQTDIPPPLAASTVARKGSSKPLVDTGQLLNAITWEVVDTRKGE